MINVYVNVHNGRFVTTKNEQVENLTDLKITEENTGAFAFVENKNTNKTDTYEWKSGAWVKVVEPVKNN